MQTSEIPLPKAVLLDVGGVFHLPGHDAISQAYADLGHDIERQLINEAHYHGAARFHLEFDRDLDNASVWLEYLDGHATILGLDEEARSEVLPRLGHAFTSMEQWSHQIEGSVAGAHALKATGVRLGIVSNADGTVAQRLIDSQTAQVGPGPGIDVEIIVDSGVVGITKPDPRIFQIALDAMGIDAADTWYVGDMPAIDVVGARRAGLFPVLVDPYDLHAESNVMRVNDLFGVAALVEAVQGAHRL